MSTPLARHLALVQAQAETWPNCLILDWAEFTAEVLSRPETGANMDGTPVVWTARLSAYAEAYPDALPYMLRNRARTLGLRYGTEGHEYLSGFPEERYP